MNLHDFLYPGLDVHIADALRYATIVHGIVYVMLVVGILLSQPKQIRLGYKAKHMVKYERALLISYLMMTGYAIWAVIEAVHTEFVIWKTPLIFFAFVFGDIALYHLYLHKDDNRE